MNKITNLSFVLLALMLCVHLCSCSSNKGDPNSTMNTEFSVIVSDSTHVLLPKTYSYLKNFNPPAGLVPVVVTVDSIEDKNIGTFADDIFDEYCEEDYIGGAFAQRGILLVVSKRPELIQVRVGQTYSVYCRMRGSTAGKEYLKMQKSIAERGLDELCPIVLNNTIADIEDCRNMPFYKKAFFKMIFSHIEIFMGDIATPSESFFGQFYFKPFIYVISLIHGLSGNWLVAFLVICAIYMLLRMLADKILMKFVGGNMESKSAEDRLEAMTTIGLIKMIAGPLLKLVVSIPTIGAITVLSTSRLEDIMTLQYYHIPYTNVLGDSMNWENSAPIMWSILLLMVIYYLKFLLCDPGMFTMAHLPDENQRNLRDSNDMIKSISDTIVDNGYNRKILQIHAETMARGSMESLDSNTAIESQDIYPSEMSVGDRQGNWISFFFPNKDSEQYKEAPFYTILRNTHYEALAFSFVLGVTATLILSSTYIVFFTVLWGMSLLVRIYKEYKMSLKIPKNGIDWGRFFRGTWKQLVVFLVIIAAVLFVMLPVYSAKNYETVDVSAAIPEDVTGLYFVQKRDGADVKGVTARIREESNGTYAMYVYSDEPVMRYDLEFNRQDALFRNEFLGVGYIEYDNETKRIKINFSEQWILTN